MEKILEGVQNQGVLQKVQTETTLEQSGSTEKIGDRQAIWSSVSANVVSQEPWYSLLALFITKYVNTIVVRTNYFLTQNRGVYFSISVVTSLSELMD